MRFRSGRWLLALATPLSYRDEDSLPTDIRSWCLFSDNDGETWMKSKSRWKEPGRGLLAPTVVERLDGSLLMLNQTNTHRQYRSHSRDRGDTWSAPTEVTRLISPDAPAIIHRDPKTGWLVVVWNRNSNRIENLYSRRVPASAQSATNRLLHFQRVAVQHQSTGYVNLPSLVKDLKRTTSDSSETSELTANLYDPIGS